MLGLDGGSAAGRWYALRATPGLPEDGARLERLKDDLRDCITEDDELICNEIR